MWVTHWDELYSHQRTVSEMSGSEIIITVFLLRPLLSVSVHLWPRAKLSSSTYGRQQAGEMREPRRADTLQVYDCTLLHLNCYCTRNKSKIKSHWEEFIKTSFKQAQNLRIANIPPLPEVLGVSCSLTWFPDAHKLYKISIFDTVPLNALQIIPLYNVLHSA